MHGDIHDIVFAPYGCFLPDPSQVQIVFVATDGGHHPWPLRFRWRRYMGAALKRLAIGQSLAIGLDPNDTTVSVSGFWHNGNAMLLPHSTDAAVWWRRWCDRARRCRRIRRVLRLQRRLRWFALPRARAVHGNDSSERIWSQSSGGNHWSDPHRPGNLLHLQNGILFRATGADLAPHAVLANPDSWIAIDPFWGKTGNTVTMAFKSRVLEEQPVYYLGTSTGQVWRGSPEAGWTKLCECGNGVAIASIGPDLRRNERIFVAIARNACPVGGLSSSREQPEAGTRLTSTARLHRNCPSARSSASSLTPRYPRTWGTALYIGTVRACTAALTENPPSIHSQWL